LQGFIILFFLILRDILNVILNKILIVFENKDISLLLHIKGLVQGVGFRPFVYRIATGLDLKGWVENRNDGVFIKIEGSEEKTKSFLQLLKAEAPHASIISDIKITQSEFENFQRFEIVRSHNISEEITDISPDIAVCNDCLKDFKNQQHRINYPFINCTNCGPRFTIIRDLPYDRDKTTMSKFIMCEICKKEYTDVLDRRFHAQPVACNNCGPKYELFCEDNVILEFNLILKKTAELIDKGKIVVIKGLGGFHIACDALNGDVVKRLRTLKQRDRKPFAVMFSDLKSAKEYTEMSEEEENSLTSWRRPIVILKEKKEKKIPVEVSNDLGTIGAMLPYMPFHYLLFEKLKTKVIVLTSGNISDTPIIIDNENAKKKLSEIYDALLCYDRDIYNRTDDSVVFVANGKERIIRRSRGYVPNAINLNFSVDGIIAAGGELKNTFCIGKKNQAILSQHIGDLKNVETFEFYKQTIEQFKKLFRINPKLYAADLHPDYLSTKYVKEIDDIEKIFIQHHHAHIASCMAEHNLDEKVIGVSFDGTGYGDDGNIWGSEFFICDYKEYKRMNHFEYIQMPGGDKVADEPWRMAVSYLYKYYEKDFLKFDLPFLLQIPKNNIELLITAIDRKINCPLTSGAGRLFDAVSALINLCTVSNFEAEAPMRLEAIIEANCNETYSYEINNTISFKKTFWEIINDINKNIPASIISAKFHNTVIHVILEVAENMREEYKINKIVLSGGVFQNRYLLTKVEKELLENKFEVYSHSKVPSNDGGIALGQLSIAAKKTD
jgi:hydrogenase maturation protein HypF